MERLADQASYDANDWYKCQLALRHRGQSFLGVITTVISFGCFVKLESLSLEGLLHVSMLPGDFYIYDEEQQILRGKESGKTFTVGQKVAVKLTHVDMLRHCIDLEIEE